jgi:hypothetical protein
MSCVGVAIVVSFGEWRNTCLRIGNASSTFTGMLLIKDSQANQRLLIS